MICDQSPALISALARSMGGTFSAKEYKEKCFDILTGKDKRVPKCYIRNDAAHFINKCAKWKLWQSVNNSMVKEHLMRCVGLLVLASTLEDFKALLTHVMILVGSETENSKVLASKEFLVEAIAEETMFESFKVTSDDKEDEEDEEYEEDEEDEEAPPNISDFLRGVEESAECSSSDSKSVNPYYLPKFGKKMLKSAKDFVLWSSVMAKSFRSPYPTGVSAHSEGIFSDLKRNVFKNESLPMPIHEFVGIHLQSIFGQGLVVASSMDSENTKKLEQQSNKSKSEKKTPSFEELNDLENWRGQGKPKRNPAKYLNKHPEIVLEVKMKSLKDPKEILLRNGSITGFPLITEKTKVQIRNTCSFDSVIQLLAVLAIENEKFRVWLESAKDKSKALDVAWKLAHQGATVDTYSTRVEALVNHANLTKASEQSSDREKKKKASSIKQVLQYDIWGNCIILFEKLDMKIFSLQRTWTCKKRHATKENCTFVSVLEDVLLSQGFGELEASVNIHKALEKKGCSKKGCKHAMTVKSVNLNDVIIIDVSVSEQMKNEIPESLHLESQDFNLFGVVAYQPGHYVSYAKRIGGYWEYFNDVHKRHSRVKDNLKLVPVILIYVSIKTGTF